MNEIMFEIVKVMMMVAILLVTRYLIPWLQEKIGADKLNTVEKWAKYAVLTAEQVFWGESGKDRKAYVTEFLKGILISKKIALSDEQLEVLIEVAVRQMKIEENSGIVIDGVGEIPESVGEN